MRAVSPAVAGASGRSGADAGAGDAVATADAVAAGVDGVAARVTIQPPTASSASATAADSSTGDAGFLPASGRDLVNARLSTASGRR